VGLCGYQPVRSSTGRHERNTSRTRAAWARLWAWARMSRSVRPVNPQGRQIERSVALVQKAAASFHSVTWEGVSGTLGRGAYRMASASEAGQICVLVGRKVRSGSPVR
jgi:hypothetical protein